MKIVTSSKAWNYEGVYIPNERVVAEGDDLTEMFLDMKNKASDKANKSDRYSRIDFEMHNDKCFSLYYYNAVERVYYKLID